MKNLWTPAVALALLLLASTTLAGGPQLTIVGPASLSPQELGTYAGTLLNPSGKAMANHAVDVLVDGHLVTTLHTDAQGGYTIGLSFVSGLHEVRANGPANAASITVNVGCGGAQVCVA